MMRFDKNETNLNFQKMGPYCASVTTSQMFP